MLRQRKAAAAIDETQFDEISDELETDTPAEGDQ